MSELLKLAERCEAASGPDRQLDFAVAKAVGAVPVHTTFDKGQAWNGGLGYVVRYYTASLDAALTLVPEECAFYIERNRAAVWIAPIPSRPTGVKRGTAATPALALCAAALRARAATESQL